MGLHLIASNATIKAIKDGDGRTRLSDGQGLYLKLFVKGGSHAWWFDYTFEGRRKTISFGTYPATTLSLARKKAEEAREQVRNGIDPSAVRKSAKQAIERTREDDRRADAGLPPDGSFEAVAREWYEKNAPNWADTHSEKIIRRLERDVFPWIGKKSVASIRPADLLELMRRVESRGAIETTHRVQQNCGQVFR
ncbi:MAG: integrase arm-type DNA-binding domain-containing protein, partial [Pseudomonadota bacterium]|nr:integrase arm-type DNA-binding domain-containing protein [Pseudomonadota bacterium]